MTESWIWKNWKEKEKYFNSQELLQESSIWDTTVFFFTLDIPEREFEDRFQSPLSLVVARQNQSNTVFFFGKSFLVFKSL